MPLLPVQSLGSLSGVSVIEVLRRGSWSFVPADTIESLVNRGRLVEFSAGDTVYKEADAERLAVLTLGSCASTCTPATAARSP